MDPLEICINVWIERKTTSNGQNSLYHSCSMQCDFHRRLTKESRNKIPFCQNYLAVFDQFRRINRSKHNLLGLVLTQSFRGWKHQTRVSAKTGKLCGIPRYFPHHFSQQNVTRVFKVFRWNGRPNWKSELLVPFCFFNNLCFEISSHNYLHYIITFSNRLGCWIQTHNKDTYSRYTKWTFLLFALSIEMYKFNFVISS